MNRRLVRHVVSAILLFLAVVVISKEIPRRIAHLSYERYISRCRPPGQVYKDFGVQVPAGFTGLGIDVSFYSCPADWSQVRRMRVGDHRIGFVYLRATSGLDTDGAFADYWSQVEQAKLPKGAYHFFYPDQDPAAQAHHFLSVVNLQKGDLPPVLDVEDNRSNLSPDEVRRSIFVWLSIVERASRQRAIIYVNRTFYDLYIKGYFTKNPIWIAAYDMKEAPVLSDGRQWLIWQFSNKGRVNGFSEPVDLNVVRDSLPVLLRLAKNTD